MWELKIELKKVKNENETSYWKSRKYFILFKIF